MPHKRNPIRAERISGLARVVRAQVVPVMEGIPLWHERDISHSSTERVALPGRRDRHRLPAGADHRPDSRAGRGRRQDAGNLEPTHGLIYTSAVLLELVAAGMSREDAYAWCRRRRWTPGRRGAAFRETLRSMRRGRGQLLDEARLDEICAPSATWSAWARVFDRLETLA